MPTRLPCVAVFLCLALPLPFSLCSAQQRDDQPVVRQAPLVSDDTRPKPGPSVWPWSLQRGVASWYGKHFHGRKTASGERFDMHALTAAHPTLPIHSLVRVINMSNRRAVIVRINDRGPFIGRRIIDLSYAAASQLGYVGRGNTRVEIELLARGDGIASPFASQSLSSRNFSFAE